VGESEGWDGPQREQDKPMGDSTPIDQFCSSCNQKKPLIDFGRFLTYNPCRQRNRKANQAHYLKQKALLNNKSSSSSDYPNNLACEIRAKSEAGPGACGGPSSKDFTVECKVMYSKFETGFSSEHSMILFLSHILCST
jgi:hypothetical protein